MRSCCSVMSELAADSPDNTDPKEPTSSEKETGPCSHPKQDSNPHSLCDGCRLQLKLPACRFLTRCKECDHLTEVEWDAFQDGRFSNLKRARYRKSFDFAKLRPHFVELLQERVKRGISLGPFTNFVANMDVDASQNQDDTASNSQNPEGANETVPDATAKQSTSKAANRTPRKTTAKASKPAGSNKSGSTNKKLCVDDVYVEEDDIGGIRLLLKNGKTRILTYGEMINMSVNELSDIGVSLPPMHRLGLHKKTSEVALARSDLWNQPLKRISMLVSSMVQEETASECESELTTGDTSQGGDDMTEEESRPVTPWDVSDVHASTILDASFLRETSLRDTIAFVAAKADAKTGPYKASSKARAACLFVEKPESTDKDRLAFATSDMLVQLLDDRLAEMQNMVKDKSRPFVKLIETRDLKVKTATYKTADDKLSLSSAKPVGGQEPWLGKVNNEARVHLSFGDLTALETTSRALANILAQLVPVIKALLSFIPDDRCNNDVDGAKSFLGHQVTDALRLAVYLVTSFIQVHVDAITTCCTQGLF